MQTEWRFSQADVDDTERQALQRLVDRWDDLATWLEVTVLKTNLLRTVYRFDTEPLITDDNALVARVVPGWVVKKYRFFGLVDRLRSVLVRTRAAREFLALSKLREWGFAVPRPLAFGERGSRGGLPVEGGLVMEEIDAAVSVVTHLGRAFDESASQPPSTADARQLLVEIGRYVARLHDRGVLHPDLHGANFLLGPDGNGGRRLVLIDLHSCRFPGRVSRRARLRALAKVAHSLSWAVPQSELRWFLASYGESAELAGKRAAEAEPDSLQEAALSGAPYSGAAIPDSVARVVVKIEAAVTRRVERLERRRVESRARRCIVNSTSFGVARQNARRVFHVRSWTAEDAIALARPIPAGEVLKASPSGWVSRLPVDFGDRASAADGASDGATDRATDADNPRDGGEGAKRDVVVKYRRYSLSERLRGIFLRHRLLRSWVASHALRVRKVAAPGGFALVERRSFGTVAAAWLIQEAVPAGQPLDTFLWETFGHAREAHGVMARLKFSVAVAVGDALRRFHSVGALSHDCSPQNLVVVRDRLEDRASNEGSRCATAPSSAATRLDTVPLDTAKWGSDELAAIALALEAAPVWLVDLDDVRFARHRQAFAARLRNLVQAGNLPEGHVSATDRLRALRAYDQGAGEWWRKDVIDLLRRGLEEEALRTIQRLTRLEYAQWSGAIRESDAPP